MTNDVRAAEVFYGQLFGWEFEDVPAHPGQFVLIRLDGIAIGGLVFSERKQLDSTESRWIGSVSVTDVDAAVQLVRDQGGEVLGGPTNIPLRGRVAVIADPQGAILALMRTEDGDPADRDPEVNDWLWQELWTTDDSSALEFYRDLMGYDHETVTVEAGAYHVLQLNGHSYAGLARPLVQTRVYVGTLAVTRRSSSGEPLAAHHRAQKRQRCAFFDHIVARD